MMMLNITGFGAVFTGLNPIGRHYTTPGASLEEYGVHPDDLVVVLAGVAAAVAVGGREVQHLVRTEHDGADAAVFLLEVRHDLDRRLVQLGLIQRFAAESAEVHVAVLVGHAAGRPSVVRTGVDDGLLHPFGLLIALDDRP